MKINGEEYKFIIEPYTTQVSAKIYKVVELRGSKYINGVGGEIPIAHKSFGNKWFGEPTKEDYVNARTWAEEQLQNIYRANKPI